MAQVNESISDLVLSYKILKDLGKKWTEFDAYKLGIIDNEGKKLKSPETSDEKESYNSYKKIIFNLKRLLQKFVGKNATVNKLTSLLLLKEGFSETVAIKVVEGLDLPSDTETISLTEAHLILEQFSEI